MGYFSVEVVKSIIESQDYYVSIRERKEREKERAMKKRKLNFPDWENDLSHGAGIRKFGLYC